MIVRTLTVLFFLALLMLSVAQDVSPGVRYKKATPQANEAFKRLLLTLHDGKAEGDALAKMFDKVVMCGPNFYGVLKRQLPEAAKSGKPMKISVPTKGQEPQQLEGRLYNTKEDILDFAITVQALCASEPMKVRVPTKDELDSYWAIIPFDIEEPIFVAESAKWSLLFNGGADGRILFFELIPRKHKE